jgi:hypothetical protein
MIRLERIAILLLFFGLATLAMPSNSPAQIAVGVSIHIGPPVMPVYAQPICPAPGYLWTPGYWAYGPDGYFWVPGTWVLAPTPGYLWTPGYWGWGGGGYFWHTGYWGPHVGFYGGINYGFGYGGVGFVGGTWHGGVFAYNTAVTNVNTTVIHNTYVNNTVVNNTTVNNHVSYNGGTGGITAQPTAAEQAAANEHHIQPTAVQTQHEQAASSNRSLLASVNHGQPAVAATAKPGVFKGEGVVAARPANSSANVNGNHPTANNASQMDRPPSARTNGTNSSPQNSPNRPSTVSQTQTSPSNTNQSSTKQTDTAKANTSGTNNNHANSSKPAKQTHESKPTEHESHKGGGGRGR